MSEITNADEARAAMEQARTDYRELVLGISEDEWNRKSNNAGWTNGQLCWHIAFGAGAGERSVARLRQNKGMDPPGPLMVVFNFLSLWDGPHSLTRRDARVGAGLLRRRAREDAPADRCGQR